MPLIKHLKHKNINIQRDIQVKYSSESNFLRLELNSLFISKVIIKFLHDD